MPNPQAVDRLALLLSEHQYDPEADVYLRDRAMQVRAERLAQRRAQGAPVNPAVVGAEADAASLRMGQPTADQRFLQDSMAQASDIGGFFAGYSQLPMRSIQGLLTGLEDLGITSPRTPEDVNAMRVALAQMEAEAAEASTSGTVGGAVPYLAAALLGGPGAAMAIGGATGLGSYGEARHELGMDPSQAALRGLGQGTLAGVGMLLNPFTRAAGAPALHTGLLPVAARSAALNAADAIPQSAVMDYGGALVDVAQGKLTGNTPQATLGEQTLRALPEHLPEMVLANAAFGAPMGVVGHRANQAAVAGARGAQMEAELAKRQFAADSNMRDPVDPALHAQRLGLEQHFGPALTSPEAPFAIAGAKARRAEPAAAAERLRMQEAEAAAQAEAEEAAIAATRPTEEALQQVRQRAAAAEASAKGVRARREAELKRLEAEAAELEQDVAGRNARENVAYLEAEIAARESAAAQAGALGRGEEYRQIGRELDQMRAELAKIRPAAERFAARQQANTAKQARLRGLLAPAPAATKAPAPAAEVLPATTKAPAPAAPAPDSGPIAPRATLPPIPETKPAVAPVAPSSTATVASPAHIVQSKEGGRGVSLRGMLKAMRSIGNAAWNYLEGKTSVISEGGYDGIIEEGASINKVTDVFGGSGLVSQLVKRIHPGAKRQVNDLNPEVVNMHTQVRDAPDAVIAEAHRALDAFATEVIDPNYDPETQATAGLTFADRFTFAGTPAGRAAAFSLRFSKLTGSTLGKGEPTAEDVPGSIKWAELASRKKLDRKMIENMKRVFADNIRGHSRDLQGAEITNRDARQVLADAQAGDFVPVDPPHYSKDTGGEAAADAGVMDYGDYGADLTTVEGSLQFIRDSVIPAAKRGVRIAYTNYWNNAVAKAFTDAGFTVRKVERQGQRGKSVYELLAFNPKGADIRDGDVTTQPARPAAGAAVDAEAPAGQAAGRPADAAGVVPAARPEPAPGGAAPVRRSAGDPLARIRDKLVAAFDGFAAAKLDLDGDAPALVFRNGERVPLEVSTRAVNPADWLTSMLGHAAPGDFQGMAEAAGLPVPREWKWTNKKPPTLQRIRDGWADMTAANRSKFIERTTPGLSVRFGDGKAGSPVAFLVAREALLGRSDLERMPRVGAEEAIHVLWRAALSTGERDAVMAFAAKNRRYTQQAQAVKGDVSGEMELGTQVLLDLGAAYAREVGRAQTAKAVAPLRGPIRRILDKLIGAAGDLARRLLRAVGITPRTGDLASRLDPAVLRVVEEIYTGKAGERSFRRAGDTQGEAFATEGSPPPSLRERLDDTAVGRAVTRTTDWAVSRGKDAAEAVVAAGRAVAKKASGVRDALRSEAAERRDVAKRFERLRIEDPVLYERILRDEPLEESFATERFERPEGDLDANLFRRAIRASRDALGKDAIVDMKAAAERAEAILAEPGRLEQVLEGFEKGRAPKDGPELIAQVLAMQQAGRRLLEQGVLDTDEETAGLAMRLLVAESRAGTSAGRILRALREGSIDRAMDIGVLFRQTLNGVGSARWVGAWRNADTPEKKKAVLKQWNEAKKQVVARIKAKTGLDINDPKLWRKLADEHDHFATNVLTDAIEVETPRTFQERVRDFVDNNTVGAGVAELVRGTILTIASPIPQAATASMFAGEAGLRPLVAAALRHFRKDLPVEVTDAFGGADAAMRSTIENFANAARIAVESSIRGESRGLRELAGRFQRVDSGDSETQAAEGGRAVTPAGIRHVLGPGAELVRLMDEFVWAQVFYAKQAFLAARKAKNGDLRDPEVIKHDQDIVDAATKEADDWTLRGEYEGMIGRLAAGVAPWRAVQVKEGDGRMRTNWIGLPFFAVFPIFKSYVKAMQRGLSIANLPGNVLTVIKALRRVDPATAEAMGVSVEALEAQRFQAGVEAGARVLLGSALLAAGALLAETSATTESGGLAEREEKVVRETAASPGTMEGIPTTRLSPWFEASQIGAIARESFKKAKEGSGKAGFETFLSASRDVLINRPLLSGLPIPRRDPETGEQREVGEQVVRQFMDVVAVGRPYVDAYRKMTETTTKAVPSNDWLERNYGLTRADRASWLGEERPTGGFWRKMLFGGASVPTSREHEIAAHIVRLNEQLARSKQEMAKPYWFPPVERVFNERAGWRYTDEEYRQVRKLTGEAFVRMYDALPPASSPRERIYILRAAWLQARAQAESIVQPKAFKRAAAGL